MQLVQPYYVNNNATMQFLRAYFTDKNMYLRLKKDHDLGKNNHSLKIVASLGFTSSPLLYSQASCVTYSVSPAGPRADRTGRAHLVPKLACATKSCVHL